MARDGVRPTPSANRSSHRRFVASCVPVVEFERPGDLRPGHMRVAWCGQTVPSYTLVRAGRDYCNDTF